MKILLPNIHFDLLRMLSLIFRSLDWEVGLLGAPEYNFFGIGKALSDPDDFSRTDHEQWIANTLGAKLCTRPEDAADADLILMTTTDHQKKWRAYATSRGLQTKEIFYLNNGTTGNPEIFTDKNFWSADFLAYQASPSANKIYWNSIFCEISPDYTVELPNQNHRGFHSYINRIGELYPEAANFLMAGLELYQQMGGKERVYFHGQRNPDGMLHMGKYGQPDQVRDTMRNSIATIQIKDTDAPGYVILRSMMLGKPLILWDRLVKNTHMTNLFNNDTCFIIKTPQELASTLIRLEQDIAVRGVGTNSAKVVRKECAWEAFKPRFLPWLERVMS